MPRESGQHYTMEFGLSIPASNTSSSRYYKPLFDAIAEQLSPLKKRSSEYRLFVEEMTNHTNSMIKASCYMEALWGDYRFLLQFNLAVHVWREEEKYLRRGHNNVKKAQRLAS
ncbi:hypothetical protein QCA50_019556 [Cerrena zonata]|uniref:Uncharacterized protein n=1 Tax=Cerrena zonata TaxID=2478898 RepID=A0AAW0FAD1_9APHY